MLSVEPGTPNGAANGVASGKANGNGPHSSSLNGASIPYIPLAYDGTDPDTSPRRLIFALRPDWAAEDSNLELVRFTDGITNTLLKAVNRRPGLTAQQVDSDAILLRAYGNGTDVLIDRLRETQNHELLMHHGLAPELLARFQNGMLYRYIPGKVTSPADLRTRPIYRAVAKRLAQWHAVVPCIHDSDSPMAKGVKAQPLVDQVAPSKPRPNVWTVMQKWILALPTTTDAQRTRQAELQAELARLVLEFSQRPGLGKNGLVFAHCDLLSGNVIIEPESVPAKATANGNGCSPVSVNFIDYEYATPSPAAFDIANHFAEWGGFDCDFSVLPTVSQRTEFIREYIHSYFSLVADKPADLDEEAEVAKLCAEVDHFRGVPGFYWGIWALIQATISDIDFDYAAYAEVRLGEHSAWRAELSGSREKQGKEMPLRERRWAQLE